ARVYLGRNWSGKVVVKEDHSLVRDGPYRWVRHPIYTGMLLALLGTALAIGEWRGFLALACALVGVLFRVHAEEARMAETFSEYAQYRLRTSALVPGIY
ncbi:MAG: methyltransferase family protein, partial [Stellaceae bacterium]